jgi:streptogramin lyase
MRRWLRLALVGGAIVAQAATGAIMVSPALAPDPLGKVTEYSIPTGGSFPTKLIAGPDGRIWFTETPGTRSAL